MRRGRPILSLIACARTLASTAPSSGNSAFDEYREETLRRLEEEQKGFVDFLDTLRKAKDKAEFDQYMADRKRSPVTRDEPEPPEDAAPQPQG